MPESRTMNIAQGSQQMDLHVDLRPMYPALSRVQIEAPPAQGNHMYGSLPSHPDPVEQERLRKRQRDHKEAYQSKSLTEYVQ